MQLDGMRATVVGAGIGGAATALLLARAGASVTLLERVAEPRAVGAGILLQPNGLAVLYGLGLRDALTAHAFVAREGAISDATGRPLLSMSTIDFGEGLDHFVALRRSTLFDALISAVDAEDRIDARFGVEVNDLPVPDVPDADVVVGADGVRSAVRTAAAIPHRLRGTGVRYVRGLVFGEPESFGRDAVGEFWTRLGLFGIAPIGGMTYFFAGTASPVVATALATGDLDAFRAAWGAVLPVAAGVLARVNSVDELLVNEVETVHCRRFVDGHVALIGDAAHAMYPNAGQGANSALVDGAVLVGRLRASSDVPSALEEYDRRRRRAVQRVQRDSARVARLSAVRSAPLRRARDALLRRTAGRGMSRRRLDRVMQVDPAALYREVAEVSAETGTPPQGPISA